MKVKLKCLEKGGHYEESDQALMNAREFPNGVRQRGQTLELGLAVEKWREVLGKWPRLNFLD